MWSAERLAVQLRAAVRGRSAAVIEPNRLMAGSLLAQIAVLSKPSAASKPKSPLAPPSCPILSSPQRCPVLVQHWLRKKRPLRGINFVLPVLDRTVDGLGAADHLV
jgi:hypothetical protein